MADYDVKEYQKDYHKKKVRHYSMSMSVDNEANMIDWVDNVGSFSLYVKKLIAEDMKRNGIEPPEIKDRRVSTGKYKNWRKQKSEDKDTD
ncbi:MAG: hypothetical protein Q4C54_05020 [Clostridia bacterium]|nr:hypothetical protein [Clostridia bacterium]